MTSRSPMDPLTPGTYSEVVPAEERTGNAGSSERPVLCVGEALIDLICPTPVATPADAATYEVHFGGALANVAVAVARAGAPAALGGGCGDDEWGALLRSRLAAEGVGLEFHTESRGLTTPFAFATLDRDREPSFRIHGAGIEEGVATLAGREAELIGAAGALVLGSNTTVDGDGRELTLRLRDAAVAAAVPVLFDPNLRPGRWDDLAEAREVCLGLTEGATLLKCNRSEARWLTGLEDASGPDLAEALLTTGAELVVLTAGTDAVLARGAGEAECRPPKVEMISPLGAGDVFMGTFVAALHAADWELGVPGPALELASLAAASACERLGAFD